MRKKVFVAMSGGVDSSVSAALLKGDHDVTGVFIRPWSPSWMPCPWKEERRDAMRVAAKLDIPLLTFDFQEEYKKEVAEYMIEEYRKGRTPNPDVMCNKKIKFGAFLEKVEYMATGHYARKEGGNLLAGVDKEKDQSYFLWTLRAEQLKRILFPVGGLKKEEVRKLAKKFDLPVADKKDSQGVCFLGKIDMRDFLQRYIPSQEGRVLNEEGEVIGHHEGSFLYTIGQRHGFVVNKKGVNEGPHYVIGKDLKKNILIVSEKKPEKLKEFSSLKVELEDINWVSGEPTGSLTARVRYRQPLQKCRVEGSRVLFEEPQAVAPGQSVVVYDKDICLGGGVVK
jgi:tRNA-specific 2-thiouridylase